MKCLIILTLILIANTTGYSSVVDLDAPWVYLNGRKLIVKKYFDLIEKKQGSDDVRKVKLGRQFSNIEHPPKAHLKGIDKDLYRIVNTLESIKKMPNSELKNDTLELNKFLIRFYLSCLKSINWKTKEFGMAKLAKVEGWGHFDSLLIFEVRSGISGLPIQDKFPVLIKVGFSESDKKQILEMSPEDIRMKSFVGDSLSIIKYCAEYEKEKSILSKTVILEEMTYLKSNVIGAAVFKDLYKPISVGDSPSTFNGLDFRKKILILLRAANPDEALFNNPLIDKPYFAKDTSAIREYLLKIGKWGFEKFGYYPRDSLSQPFISYPVKQVYK